MPKLMLIVSCVCVVGSGRVSAQSVGEFTLSAGMAQGVETGGPGSRVALVSSFSFVKSRFSFGPELLYAAGTPHVIGVAGVVRVRVGGGKYLVGSLGGNSWRWPQFVNANLLSGSIGAGMTFGAGSSRDRFMVELRYNDNLQNYAGLESWGFLTAQAGIRFGW
ncbi:MAG: hypothetical protein ABI679_14620 [Gemmatimonadota bacterium]